MIYEISIGQLPQALQNGASLRIISSDSAYALVQADFMEDYINSYQDQDYNIVISDPKWRQPCIGCED